MIPVNRSEISGPLSRAAGTRVTRLEYRPFEEELIFRTGDSQSQSSRRGPGTRTGNTSRRAAVEIIAALSPRSSPWTLCSP
ncbi:hypothetical protein GN956_G13811 [Arapaima gigas]